MFRFYLRKVFETQALGFLRHWVAVRVARRDEVATEAMAERMGFGVLAEADLKQLRHKSDTLFILGSGPSVLDLTEQEFSQIKLHCSIGLNSWVLHDFVPDAYSFEEVESDLYVGVAEGLSLALSRPEVVRKKPLILMLRPHVSTPKPRLVEISRELATQVRLYGRLSLPTGEPSNLVEDLRKLFRSMIRGRFPPAISIDAGMSISRLVSLGVRSGFTTIVLLGVDLGTSNYFFDLDPRFLKRRGIRSFDPWQGRGPTHDTESRDRLTRRASVFIPALAQAAKFASEVEIFVGSPSSVLAEKIPVLDWNSL